MSILSALVRAYESRAKQGKAPAFGFSQEKIGYLISLHEDGTPAGTADGSGAAPEEKTHRAADVRAAASFKSPSGITPKSFFLWDNTAYLH